MLESILQRTLPLVALVGIACGSDSSSSPSCAADTDCKGDRVCVDGKCEGYGSPGTPGDNSGSQTQYTCESGVDAFITICCPIINSNTCGPYHPSPSECSKSDFMQFCGEQQNIDSTFAQNYFSCAIDICSRYDTCLDVEMEGEKACADVYIHPTH